MVRAREYKRITVARRQENSDCFFTFFDAFFSKYFSWTYTLLIDLLYFLAQLSVELILLNFRHCQRKLHSHVKPAIVGLYEVNPSHRAVCVDQLYILLDPFYPAFYGTFQDTEKLS